MAIQIAKRFTVAAPPDRVWAYLTDPHRVSGCLPGSSITGQDGDAYDGSMKVKLGPVSTTYTGTVRFDRMDAESYTAELSAEGRDTRGKGAADMTMVSVLRPATEGTEVSVDTTVHVTGVLAQLGRGMVEDVSDQLFERFVECMKGRLEADPAAPEADRGGEPGAPSPGPSQTDQAASPASDAVSGAAPDQALDLGGIGGRAAARAGLRALRSPVLWVFAAAVAALIWMFVR